MIRTVLSTNSNFAIQTREEGRWRTVQTVDTLDKAQQILDLRGEPIHYTSLRLQRGKRVKARGGL